MSLESLAAVIVGATIALVSQYLVSRMTIQSAGAMAETARWDSWREATAETWAQVVVTTSKMRHMPDRSSPEVEAYALELRVARIGLHRLSVLTPDRHTSEWAVETARWIQTAEELALGKSTVDADDEWEALASLFNDRVDWRDGAHSSALERLRDAIRNAEPQPRQRRTLRRYSQNI